MAQNTSLYRAFGVDFQSALDLPEMRAGNEGGHDPVGIERRPAPCPNGLVRIDKGVAAGPRDFWMDVQGVARLHVADGLRIGVEIAGGARAGEVRAYLLGSALGALLHQRGLLPLHASAVVIDGRAVAFAGTSGAGKSTMALHLNRRGHPLLCDDICAVDFSGPAPVVWPGLCNLKLWGEALASAGRAAAGLEPVLPGLDKYRLPVAATAPYRPYPLGTLFCLYAGPDDMGPTVDPLGGADATGALVANSFRGQLVSAMARNRTHFEHCVALARTGAVVKLIRPWSIDAIDASCALVENRVRTS